MPVSTNSLQFGEVFHPVTSDFAPSSAAFTELLSLIPEENELCFSTAADLAVDIKVKVEECLEAETGCYMLVTGVAEEMIEPIQKEMEQLGIRQAARFTYKPAMESLIIRLMPGVAHENVSQSFCFSIWNTVANLPGHSQYSLRRVGTTKFHIACSGIKEGDGGFKPLDIRGNDGEWPSLVVEVGYWESLPALRCDAQMWLENTRGQIRMVIIIEIAKNPNELRLECWKMVVDPNDGVSRDNIQWTPVLSQHFDIDHAGTVSPAGHDLVIPYRALFYKSQPGDPDIIISARELSEWALVIYSQFRHSQPQAQ